MVQIRQHALSFEEPLSDIQDFRRDLSSRSSEVQNAIQQLAKAENGERGAVFTRKEVIEFILDLVGYIPEERLSQTSLLEPSFGSGDFLLVALERLLQSYFLHGGRSSNVVSSLRHCLQAVELNHDIFSFTRKKILALLKNYAIPSDDAEELVNAWLRQDDFLLTPFQSKFTYVVGNPPYLRQELIPDTLITHYRSIYKTIYDRADLYVPFIERGLSLLALGGKLCYICADRWMKNKYGGPLREFIAKNFHLQTYVDMVDTHAFQSEVIAYPAIIVLTTQKQSETYVAHTPEMKASSLQRLAVALREGHDTANTNLCSKRHSLPDAEASSWTGASPVPTSARDGSRLIPLDASRNEQHVYVSTNILDGSKPWIIGSSDKLTLLRRLEEEFPLLEDEGCKVGIGVATGCDSIYIRLAAELPIEEERKLPLVMVSDLQQGNLVWHGHYVVNPFDDMGGAVDLRHYPLLAHYFSQHEEKIRNRHVARNNPKFWYRTIDKISVPLMRQPKLLIPDIKGEPTAVLDEGKYYPHHNLYYVTSTKWDLRALQAILLSPLAKLFVEAYSVTMRGGYLRFQAQNLRRIRLPRWEDVPTLLCERLIESVTVKDRAVCNEVVFELYQLNKGERDLLQ